MRTMRGETVSTLYRHAMMRELRANDYKGGWLGRGARSHLRDLDYHVAKLRAAVRARDTVRIREYAADVGNHAMFLAHDVGALNAEVRSHREQEPDFAPALRATYAWLLLRYPRKAILGLIKSSAPQEHPPSTTSARIARDEGAQALAGPKPSHGDRLTGIFT